ncbi:hypothetical protein SAMN05443549_101250 [Flavobacterium fluvii]|uniref:Uncharacterized protein n=1 Tax=Flavobacterium fluvii TaxID=468056 RepID=A0A1M5EA38_9FLAO|nr:hypothetical protein [Flavobacterium fluvii]SHF75931.1 hypothetical protein SAMN05443549_101250 [Flavobacterium fluvii]
MKKLLFIAIALLGLNSNAQYNQNVFFGENKNDGFLVDLATNKHLCEDNSICVEINLLNATVEIVNFGEIRIYDIYSVKVLSDGYHTILCSSELYQDIEVNTNGLYISVIYNHAIMACAEYPLNIQLQRLEAINNDPRLDKETGAFRPK